MVLWCYTLSGQGYNFILFSEQFSVGNFPNFFRYDLIVSNAFGKETISVQLSVGFGWLRNVLCPCIIFVCLL